MVCSHLRELYDLCEKNQLRLGSSDLIRIVCKKCNQEETCPSVLVDEYDSDYHDRSTEPHLHTPSESPESPGK
jgi:uncharacterized Zn-finger protein